VEHSRSNDGAAPSPNDHRMWRLVLARLHPDAGGIMSYSCLHPPRRIRCAIKNLQKTDTSTTRDREQYIPRQPTSGYGRP
jgi:hypothetical protein